jgi:hypothetical protein
MPATQDHQAAPVMVVAWEVAVLGLLVQGLEAGEWRMRMDVGKAGHVVAT